MYIYIHTRTSNSILIILILLMVFVFFLVEVGCPHILRESVCMCVHTCMYVYMRYVCMYVGIVGIYIGICNDLTRDYSHFNVMWLMLRLRLFFVSNVTTFVYFCVPVLRLCLFLCSDVTTWSIFVSNVTTFVYFCVPTLRLGLFLCSNVTT